MSDVMIWFWLGVFIFAVGIEFATTEFVSVWFAISAIPTLIVSIFYPTMIWLQIIVFFSIGFILMGFTRPVLVKYFRRNVVDTNVDSFIGKVAIVVKEITEIENGSVKFQSDIWTAMSSEHIEVGEQVRILAIEGNKLIVTKLN
ncbi:MAG TPA: NfeD family protein [Acholeplasma sp.]|nr:NfeD family protein [Acholeplasma sp.]